ncbi:MAG: AMP-binding protein, partial [Acidobacteria bacterium]|nr:AMP-binding protein [Acidobacteriota bacterium]
AIPVPIYPPIRADRIEEFATRQARILRNAEAMMLITVERGEALAQLLRPAVPSLTEVLTVPIRERADAPWPAIPRGGDRPALIQYTSGSTGNPKGVLLTHANLLANIRAIGQAVGLRADDSGVCWLPLYHDMGLIGCWLMSLYYGFPLAVMSPLEFLSRPERWLWTIHSHRATLSVGPNFAYDLCVRKIRDESIEGLDLSCWRAALNGSEAVRPETLERFAARFGPYGFRPEAMLPVYGLAESTVALSFPPLERRPKVDRVRREAFEQQRRAEPGAAGDSALAFVSVGRPIEGHEIRIVDEADQPVGERVEGRILFRGPSSMAGYFRQPEITAAITHGDWLDSGDLGYWAEGELFVTGRSKDIILKTGRNLYPQEIESAVAELEGIRKGCVAAFGAADPEHGTERLIVVAETREPAGQGREQLRGQVAQRVMDLLAVPVDDVVLLDPGLLPKTSSGKLRRNAARQAYEQGTLASRHPSMAWQWTRLGGRWAMHSVAQWAQTGGRVLYSGWFYAWFVLLLGLCCLVLLVTPSGRPAAGVLRFFTRLFLRLAGIRVELEGLEHLERGPLVLVSNHASYVDPLVFIGALPRHFLFVAKKETLDMPLLGGILRKIGHLIVDRYSVAQSVTDVECIERALGQGWSVLVFAEGTFTRSRGLRPFKLGGFKAAAEAGCPVAPVAIRGSRYVLPDQTWLLRRAPMRVIVRPVIVPAGRDWREIVRLRDAAFAEILACCGEQTTPTRSSATRPGWATCGGAGSARSPCSLWRFPRRLWGASPAPGATGSVYGLHIPGWPSCA